MTELTPEQQSALEALIKPRDPIEHRKFFPAIANHVLQADIDDLGAEIKADAALKYADERAAFVAEGGARFLSLLTDDPERTATIIAATRDALHKVQPDGAGTIPDEAIAQYLETLMQRMGGVIAADEFHYAKPPVRPEGAPNRTVTEAAHIGQIKVEKIESLASDALTTLRHAATTSFPNLAKIGEDTTTLLTTIFSAHMDPEAAASLAQTAVADTLQRVQAGKTKASKSWVEALRTTAPSAQHDGP